MENIIKGIRQYYPVSDKSLEEPMDTWNRKIANCIPYVSKT